MRSLLSLVIATTVFGQTATTPVAGVVLNGNGRLLSVAGVLGTLLPGVPFRSYGRVLSATFGGNGGAINTESQLIVLDAANEVLSQTDAPAGPALFGFGVDGAVEWVYFAGTSQIQSLTGQQSFSTGALGDEILALGATDPNGLGVLARTGSQLWAETVALGSGEILAQTPLDGSAPGAFFEGGWLVQGGAGLLCGTREWAIPAAITSLQSAGAQSVAINGQWLLNSAGKILEIPAIERGHLRVNLPPPAGARR